MQQKADYKALVFDNQKKIVNIVYWCNVTRREAQDQANKLFFPMYLTEKKTQGYTWKIYNFDFSALTLKGI